MQQTRKVTTKAAPVEVAASAALQQQGQFSIDKQSLFVVLQTVQTICSRKTALDSTSNILLQVSARELLVQATDLEISFQASFTIESKLTGSFKFLVHAKRLMELIKELEGQITFVWNGSSVCISANNTPDVVINLSTMAPETFPHFPERIENLIDVDADFLHKAIDQTDPFIPVSNANPALNGLLVRFDSQGLSFVATDGHSLALLNTTKYCLSESCEWIIPKRAVSELKKCLELGLSARIFIGICSGQLVFSGGNFNFFTRQIADKFPDFKPILQRDSFFTGQINKALFVSTLKRAVCLLAGTFVSANFKFSADNLEVSLINKEIGSLVEKVPLQQFDGQTVSCNFYPPYVLTALQNIDVENASFMIKSGVSPLFLDVSQDQTTTTYLIMPVVNNARNAA